MPPAARRTAILAGTRSLRLAGRLALTTALGTLILGYGRRAYAGSCSGAGGVFLCAGPADAAADVAQLASGTPLSVTTAEGFGLDTSRAPGTGLNLTGTGGLSFDGRADGLSILTEGTGVKAVNAGGGTLMVDTRGGSVTAGRTSYYDTPSYVGIEARNGSGGTGMTIRTADIDATDLAILARNAGAGSFVVDTTAGRITARRLAISAANDGTDLLISTGAVQSFTTNAITAVNEGSGRTRIDTTAGDVTGRGIAIYGKTQGVGIDISTGNVAGGVKAANFGSGSVSVDTTQGLVEASGLSGVYVFAAAMALDVTVRTADVSGARGVRVTNNGTGSTRIDTTAGTAIADTAGILVQQAATAGAVSIYAGDVGAYRTGIRLSSESNAPALIDTRAGTVRADTGIGILADARNLAIRTADVTGAALSGTADGIYATNRAGRISVDTTAGNVTGNGRNGISIVNQGTDVSLKTASVSGAVDGIKVNDSGTGSTAVDVVSGAVVTGGVAAVDLRHSGAGSFSLANAGTLRNASGDPAALAVKAEAVDSGSGFSLRNTGVITGTVQLTAKDDSFLNDGTWNMAGGTSDFGAGFDRFENRSDLTFVAAADPGQAETTALAGLETFRNSGTITLRDGAVGDVLSTSGNFDGAGGTIRLDMTADGSAADLFRILGNVTGGPSLVKINYLGTGGALGVTSVPFIEVAGETKEGDFRIANPVWDGLVYKMVLDGANRWGAIAAFTVTDVLAGLARDARVAGHLLDGQQAGLVNALSQDCTRFGASGACLSLAGRRTMLDDDMGASDALVLTAAVQPAASDWRMGAFLDQRVAGELPDGFSFESMGPTLGGFAGYGAADGLGLRLRVSGAWSTARLGIERPALMGLIEGGKAEASFFGWGVGGEAGYGFALGDVGTLTPFAGVRRAVSTRGAYAEAGRDAAYPLTADRMSLAQTTLTGGLTLEAGLGEVLSLSAGFGVEHDVACGLDRFEGSLQGIGTFASAADPSWLRTRLFGGARLDYEMTDGMGLSFAASARQLPFDGATDLTATAAIRVSF